MQTKGDGNVTNPQPKKILELNVYGSPSVSGVFITSHFPLRWNTHAQTRYTFISLLAELYVAEYQTPPFPKCDPLRFTSSIKTFQWSWDSVLSPCTKAPPMGRHSSPPKWKKQNAAVMKNTSSFRPLQQIFSSLLSGYHSVPPTGSNAISDTLLRPWHSTSNTHLLYGATGRLTHTSSLPGNCTHTRPDWQINVRDECKRTRPEASLITITPLLYRLVKRFTVWETIFPTGLQVPPRCL